MGISWVVMRFSFLLLLTGCSLYGPLNAPDFKQQLATAFSIQASEIQYAEPGSTWDSAGISFFRPPHDISSGVVIYTSEFIGFATWIGSQYIDKWKIPYTDVEDAIFQSWGAGASLIIDQRSGGYKTIQMGKSFVDREELRYLEIHLSSVK